MVANCSARSSGKSDAKEALRAINVDAPEAFAQQSKPIAMPISETRDTNTSLSGEDVVSLSRRRVVSEFTRCQLSLCHVFVARVDAELSVCLSLWRSNARVDAVRQVHRKGDEHDL